MSLADTAKTCDEVAAWLTGDEGYQAEALAEALTEAATDLRTEAKTKAELIEALQRLIKATDEYYREQPSAETVNLKCAEMVLADEQARAAIAKAGGGK